MYICRFFLNESPNLPLFNFNNDQLPIFPSVGDFIEHGGVTFKVVQINFRPTKRFLIIHLFVEKS